MSYPQALVIQRNLLSKDIYLEFVAFCKSSIHQIGDEQTREKKMKYFHQLVGDERGLATAEYAVATVAACGFGGVLLKILGSATVTELLTDLIRKALGLVM
jgi:Protein of unknown function (DUF4244)